MNEIDTSRVMLWQYDKADTFISLLEAKEDVINDIVKGSWDSYYSDVFNLNTCNAFGLWLWGNILGISRPMYETEVAGVMEKTPISDKAYRRVLKARLYLMNGNPSLSKMVKFYSILLDCGEGSSQPNKHVYVLDNLDMTCTVMLEWTADEETQVVLQLPSVNIHSTGVQLNFNLTGEDAWLGFNGYYNSADTNRKGVLTTLRTIWTYYDSVLDKVISPKGDYFYYDTSGETPEYRKLDYFPFENEYYYYSGSAKKICGKPVEETSGGTMVVVYRPISAHSVSNENAWVVLAPEVSYWEYTDLSGKKVIPAGEYYNSNGTQLSYDAGKNEYYLTNGGVREVYGRWVNNNGNYINRPIYDMNTGSLRQLTGSDEGVFYIENGVGGYKEVINTPYDKAGHELFRDRSVNGAKWYYTGTATVNGQVSNVKIYAYGQSMPNFDNANFYPAEAN